MKNRIKLGFCSIVLALVLAGCGHSSSGLSAEKEAEAAKERTQGIEAYTKGDYSAAQEAFTNALGIYGDTYSEIHLDTLYYSAATAYALEEYDKAITLATELIEHGEKIDLADAYRIRGDCYVALRDENNAVLDYEESLKLNSGDYATYCAMYRSFLDAGYTDRAESYLKRLTSSKDATNILLGKTYYNLGRYAEAETYLKAAEDEGEKEGSYYLALTYEAEEKYDEAEEFYAGYVQKYPTDATIHNQYGAYLIRREQYEKALEYIEAGLALESSGDEYRALLFTEAVCYEYLSDYAKARELFQNYLALYPSDAAAIKEAEFLETR